MYVCIIHKELVLSTCTDVTHKITAQTAAALLLDNTLLLEPWYDSLLSNLGEDCKEEKEEEDESNNNHEFLNLRPRKGLSYHASS